MNLDDPKHPLASFISLARSLRPDEYAKLYGDKELDDIIKDKKKLLMNGRMIPEVF